MKSDTRVTHSFYCKYRMLDFKADNADNGLSHNN